MTVGYGRRWAKSQEMFIVIKCART